MDGLRISVQWRTAVATDNGEAYNYPDKFTSFFRERYSVPVVYRWRVMRKEGGQSEPIYIGESDELPRRIQRVRTPSTLAKDSDTNKRLHEIFKKYLSEGQSIVIDWADVDPFEIDGIRLGREDLGDRFKRRAIENILLVLAQNSRGLELLNMTIDPIDRAMQKLKKLKPHEIREVIQLYGLDGPQK